jgi:hypothetical protein
MRYFPIFKMNFQEVSPYSPRTWGGVSTAQKIPADQLAGVYQILQTPERIFENTTPKSKRFGREFHFVKDAKGKVIKVVLRQRMPGTALRIVTMGYVEDQYGNPAFKKIW